MSRGAALGCGVTLVLVLLLFALSIAMLSASNACFERGGIYAQTGQGWKCLKAEELL